MGESTLSGHTPRFVTHTLHLKHMKYVYLWAAKSAGRPYHSEEGEVTSKHLSWLSYLEFNKVTSSDFTDMPLTLTANEEVLLLSQFPPGQEKVPACWIGKGAAHEPTKRTQNYG